MIVVKPDGPVPAKIMILGEAPGLDEERAGIPFVGVSGQELNRMLGEAGISRSECFVTNVSNIRPPANQITAFIAQSKKEITYEHREILGKWVLPPIFDGIRRVQTEIALVKPNVIVTLGNTALWALTGNWSVSKWRGSMLHCLAPHHTQVVPTFHPAAILRQWSWRAPAVNDLKRAAKWRDRQWTKPAWKFTIRPTFDQVIVRLYQLRAIVNSGPLRISFDIETRLGHISCAGLSWSYEEAMCIPLMIKGTSRTYWSHEEESEIIHLLYQILTHENAQVVGQNIMYDSQYTWRHWCFVPRVVQDTMISQHAIFSDLPKGLGFLASMYCEYFKFWKDEGKNI